MLHIFRDPRYALIMIRLRLVSVLPSSFFLTLFPLWRTESALPFPPSLSPFLSLFVRTRGKVYARAHQLTRDYFCLRLQAKFENEVRI